MKNANESKSSRVMVLGDDDDGRYPFISELLAESERSLREGGALNVILRLKPKFDDLLRRRAFVLPLRDEMIALAKDGARVPPATNGQVYALAESENFILTLALLTSEPKTDERIYSLANDALVANLSPNTFAGRLHHLPSHVDNQIFDPDCCLTAGESFDLTPWTSHYWDSKRHVPDYSAKAEQVLLKLNAKINQPLIWVFDRESLRPVMASACSAGASRLQNLAVCLSELESVMTPDQRTTSEESLLALSNHALHFVRWTALQKLYDVSPSQAIRRLTVAAAEDPHPHVREASQESLTLISN